MFLKPLSPLHHRGRVTVKSMKDVRLFPLYYESKYRNFYCRYIRKYVSLCISHKRCAAVLELVCLAGKYCNIGLNTFELIQNCTCQLPSSVTKEFVTKWK